MANHPYNQHREQQVAHRRVNTILSGSPAGATKHLNGGAFSKVTSKTAAMDHDEIGGKKSSPGRFARGGKVKHGHSTNIAIVMPKGGAPAGAAPPMPAGAPMAAPPRPMGPPPMGGGMPGMPPGGPPPGMPMHAKGGRVAAGEDTKANDAAWSKRAKSNSFMRGGAATGVGREEKAASMKKKK